MKLGNHTITVVRADEGTDDWDNPIRDWDNATETPVEFCSVQPVAGPEEVNGQDTTEWKWLVWAPISADVTPVDRVVYRGISYEVAGAIDRWDFPPDSHFVIPLKLLDSTGG